MHFYQWLVPLIALFFIVRIVRQYVRRRRLWSSMLIWLVFWVVISILAIIPDLISTNMAEFLGFASNINAVIFVGLGFLYVFMFYLTVTVEKLEKRLTETVRWLALENQRLKEEQEMNEKKKDEDSVRP